jgi:diacylglycerol kinase family enzyme
MGGEVARRVNRSALFKRHAGGMAYTIHAALVMLGRPSYPVRLTLDDQRPQGLDITMCAVCNGRYFGGGLHVAPNASPQDGRFDVVLVTAVRRLTLVRSLLLVRSGRHLALPCVRESRARSLTAEPANATARVPLELDGDTPDAWLPARFDLLPRALALRC